MMKKILVFFGMVGVAVGQSSYPFSISAPLGVQNISAQVTGNPGASHYSYFVVANLPAGQAQTVKYAEILNGPNTFSSSNFVTVSWSLIQGATSYDVIRTVNRTTIPSTCTACAVAIGLSSTTNSFINNSATTNAYSYAPIGNATAEFTFSNTIYTIPTVYLNAPINVLNFSQLPPAGSSSGQLYIVADAASEATCGSGGGANTPALCWSNGSSYLAMGGGGGGGGGCTTSGTNGNVLTDNGIGGCTSNTTLTYISGTLTSQNGFAGSSSFVLTGPTIAKPAAPASGKMNGWFDSTNLVFQGQNSTAAIAWTTIVPISFVTHQWVSYIDSTGVAHQSQPAASDLSSFPALCTGGQVSTGLTPTSSNCTSVGTGSVTSFSSGNLSPLFTTSVATATTTPALSFVLSNFGADNIFGNFTGGSATPSTQAIPACANDGSHALVYASHTLTCATITTGGTGTVTSFSAGNASPLFTTSVATATSTPALTFNVTSQSNATFLSNVSGGSAAPSFNSLPTTNNALWKGNANGQPAASSVTDNGTTVATTEAVTALSVATGTSPPTCTPGTGGVDCYAEGTAPSMGPASGVDVVYGDSIQHGFLANFNNAGYFPIVQGPTTSTVNHLACWNATNGGLLSDCGTPGSGTVTSIATNNGVTGGTITTTGTIGLANQNADSLLLNATGSAAPPTGNAVPSCSGPSNALTYNTISHAFGCNTISGGGGSGGASIAGPAFVSLPPNSGVQPIVNVEPGTLGTLVNCSSSATPAVCGGAPSGSVAIPTGVNPTLTVNTSAVTLGSQIILTSDDSLGTKLGVTCNSTLATLVGGMAITGRNSQTSFTISFNGTVTTNPVCLSYLVIN